jgi:CRP/FNR family cyclic AMP-dependent transcriptional regulator
MVRTKDAKASEYLHILRRADVFYDLEDHQLEMVAALCREVSLRSGDVLFEESSAGDEMYVIADGEIDIELSSGTESSLATDASPAPVTIAKLRPGQMFGEVALVDEGLRSAAARSASDKTRLLVIRRDDLIQLCEENTDLGFVLMRNIAADLAFKIRRTDLNAQEQLFWRPGKRQEG